MENRGFPTGIFSLLWNAVRGRLVYMYSLLIVSVILAQSLDAMVPVATRNLINVAEGFHAGTASEEALWGQLAVLIGVFTCAVLLGRSFQFVESRTTPVLRCSVSGQYYSFVLRQHPSFLDQFTTAELVQFGGILPRAASVLLEIIFIDLTKFIVLFLFSIGAAATMNAWLSATLVLWVIIYVLVSLVASLRIQRLSRALAQISTSAQSEAQDVISNIESVIAYGGAEEEEKRLKMIVGEEAHHTTRLRLNIVYTRLVQALLSLACIFIVTTGTLLRFVRTEALIGDVAMMFGLTSLLCITTWQLSGRMSDFAEQAGAMVHVLTSLSARNVVERRNRRVSIKVRPGAIEFRDVFFRYAQGPDILRGFNLHINLGERIGITGPSGAGKTTLLRLLRRTREVDKGEIYCSGCSITAMADNELNEMIAEVPQTPILFNRSILDNVRYGCRSATQEDVENVCRQADCHDFIVELPHGYRTVVGEGGARLSAGERQRIAIARALLKRAPILILDEITSGLDSEAESSIVQTLNALPRGRTVIVVAHRLSTLRHMDRILWLYRGAIQEMGTHHELLSRNGSYAKAWAHQRHKDETYKL